MLLHREYNSVVHLAVNTIKHYLVVCILSRLRYLVHRRKITIFRLSWEHQREQQNDLLLSKIPLFKRVVAVNLKFHFVMQRFLKIKTILFCAFSGETTPIFNNGGDFFFYNVRIFKADVDFVLIGLIEEHCFSNHRSHCYNPLISTSNTDMRLSTMRRCFVFCVVI